MAPLRGIYDQHLHTWHSIDSRADPEQNVLQATDRGLSGLTFTDHFDTHPSEWEQCQYDYTAIAADIESLRQKYGDQIFIGHGIEVDFQPDQVDKIVDILTANPFDLVILSVHWVGDHALHRREHWNGVSVESGTQSYFEAVLRALRWAEDLNAQTGRRLFDVFGHLDLVKRYVGQFFRAPEVRPDDGLLTDVLAACIDADIVPEVNLSPFRRGLDQAMPSEWIVEKYAELGGRSMSLGSDAHKPHDVAGHMEKGVEILTRCGIPHLSVFRDRQRQDLRVGI
jgi:histidinol-phosphatase (PHP family)